MIPFNKPYFTGHELSYIKQAHTNGHLSGDGAFTDLCSSWLEKTLSVKKALLTHSCTAASWRLSFKDFTRSSCCRRFP